MFGINQIITFNMAVSQSMKKAVKLSYNTTTILCRNASTLSENNNEQQSVTDFYAGKSVFITGGTGFLGKIFIEKLLYSCTDIDKVYILIRDKKGQTPKERLREMLNNPLYNRLKKFKPHALQKVVPIIGDISLSGLGISPEDVRTLNDKVSIVFHSAATVKFFEPLSVAMKLNFDATREMIELSRRMKNLENFVYISTAYTQTIYPVLEEKVYPPPAEINHVYDFMKKYGDDKKKTSELIGKRPHTYSFTKSLSENYVGKTTDIPVTIVRPSIVCSTAQEPFPGWLDNWYGMTGLATDIARGFNYYCLGKPSNKVDLIPVDHVTNLSLIAGAKYKSGNSTPVYNSVSSGSNPVTLEKLINSFIADNLKYGCYVGTPHVKYYDSKLMLDLATLLVHKTPAYINDVLLRLKGEEPRYMNNVKRVMLTRFSMENFSEGNWTFKNDAARALYASLSKADQAEFPCDPSDINWDKYLKDFFTGMTTYLLPRLLEKEKAAIKPRAIKKALTN